MLDTSGKEIPTPEEAEVFQFNFIKDGEDYGKVTISVDGLHKLCVYYSDDVANSEKEESESDDVSRYLPTQESINGKFIPYEMLSAILNKYTSISFLINRIYIL